MPGFKDQLLRLAHLLDVLPQDFNAVGIYAWPSILQKIEKAFVQTTNSNTHFNWWWESFKKPYCSLFFENGDAYTYLNQLLNPHENVWFVACDTAHDPSKFWLFQGTVEAIQKILHEHHAFEYYIVSKKYAWLICETDHDVLFGLGGIIPKLQALEFTIGKTDLRE